MDLRGSIPTIVHNNGGKSYDLDALIFEPGAVNVIAHGYLDFAPLYRLGEAGKTLAFVTKNAALPEWGRT